MVVTGRVETNKFLTSIYKGRIEAAPTTLQHSLFLDLEGPPV